MNGRPGALNHSTTLQEFTQARYVRLRLQGLRRSGETIADKRRAFYSIKEINIGGRCVCSGHAARCRYSVQHGVSARIFYNERIKSQNKNSRIMLMYHGNSLVYNVTFDLYGDFCGRWKTLTCSWSRISQVLIICVTIFVTVNSDLSTCICI